MKIAHLVPTLHPNGPEIGLVDLAGAAHEADLELVVVALAATSDTTHVSALRRLGVPVVELPSGAGHDAGILAERIPAAMLLVRNERGISHAPDEDIAVSDAAWGAEAVLRALEALR